MRVCKLARSVSRIPISKSVEQHAMHTVQPAAAPVQLRTADRDEQSLHTAEHERRIQEMYRASTPANAELAMQQTAQRRRDLPSTAAVADRLKSSKGTSCSSSISTADTNTGIDWREAVAMLRTADRQHLQSHMLTDTFRSTSVGIPSAMQADNCIAFLSNKQHQ